VTGGDLSGDGLALSPSRMVLVRLRSIRSGQTAELGGPLDDLAGRFVVDGDCDEPFADRGGGRYLPQDGAEHQHEERGERVHRLGSADAAVGQGRQHPA
jgi:hypothetical protein